MLPKLETIFESLSVFDLEAYHLFLTWFWIFTGCLSQFWTVCRHIGTQDYLPPVWKCVIVVSSAFLLGPTTIHFYSIIVILSSKLNLHEASFSEWKMKQNLEAALLFASRAKLGEIFFESFPQFLTQVMMTSGKGERGVRELTYWQKMSVLTSAATIALGISNFGVRISGAYLSRKHKKMTSHLVLAIFSLSEVAFCGGLCRFSFALKVGGTSALAMLIPFIALSSALSMAPIICYLFQWTHGEVFFLTPKLCLWAIVAGLFFFTQATVTEPLQDLTHNNSFVTFVVTMTLTSIINFTLGFFIHKQRTDFHVYQWVDAILKKMVDTLTEPCTSETECRAIHTESDQVEESTEDSSNKEVQIKSQKTSKVETGISHKTSHPSMDNLRSRARERFCSMTVVRLATPLLIIFLLSFAVIALFFYPLDVPQEGYCVEFYCDCISKRSDLQGFPVVSACNDSLKGSICVKNRTPLELVQISKVIAKQIRYEELLLVGISDYNGKFDMENIKSLQKPILQPICTGEESNLIFCKHYGLNVRLKEECYEGTHRLFVSIIKNHIDFPGYHSFFMMEADRFSACEKNCHDIALGEMFVSRLVGENEGALLIKHLPKRNTEQESIWLVDGGYLTSTEKGNKIVLPQNVRDEILPSICVVFRKCKSNPCQNRGTCFDNANSFLCVCTSSWTGKFCGKFRLWLT